MGVGSAKGPLQIPLCTQKGVQGFREGPCGGVLTVCQAQTHPFPECSDALHGCSLIWLIPHYQELHKERDSVASNGHQPLAILEVGTGPVAFCRQSGTFFHPQDPHPGFDRPAENPCDNRRCRPCGFQGPVVHSGFYSWILLFIVGSYSRMLRSD